MNKTIYCICATCGITKGAYHRKQCNSTAGAWGYLGGKTNDPDRYTAELHPMQVEMTTFYPIFRYYE